MFLCSRRSTVPTGGTERLNTGFSMAGKGSSRWRRLALAGFAWSVDLILTSCGSNVAYKEGAVAAQMLDPTAVQFRNVMSGLNTLCGELNAKNRFGGYVGFRPFVAYFPEGGAPLVDFGPTNPLTESDYGAALKIDDDACQGAKIEFPKMGITTLPDQCNWAQNDKERRENTRRFEQSLATCSVK